MIAYSRIFAFPCLTTDNIMSVDELCTIIGSSDKHTNIDFKYLISSGAVTHSDSLADSTTNQTSSSNQQGPHSTPSMQSKTMFADRKDYSNTDESAMPKDCMWPNALQVRFTLSLEEHLIHILQDLKIDFNDRGKISLQKQVKCNSYPKSTGVLIGTDC